MAGHLRELAPTSEMFIMKVVDLQGENKEVPVVEFYKRTTDGLLASLNDTLVLEPEIL